MKNLISENNDLDTIGDIDDGEQFLTPMAGHKIKIPSSTGHGKVG